MRELKRLTSLYIIPCRRRTDDTRRVLLIITIECLFAIVNSWFSDLVLSLVYCKRNLSAGDNCPNYLQKNYDLLVTFDMFNSISNIVLHCLCSKRFRNELQRMLKSFLNCIKDFFHHIWCCYCQIDCKRVNQGPCVYYSASVTQCNNSNSSSNASRHRLYLRNQKPSRQTRKQHFDYRWHFNKELLINPKPHLSLSSKKCSSERRIPHSVRYRLYSQRTDLLKPTSAQSMRLCH